MGIKGEVETIGTNDHIEEDLANFDEEKLISPEVKERSITNACRDVLTNYGRFISREKLDKVFPGIDINNLEEYDFKNAKFKTFILDDEAFKEFRKAIGDDEDYVGLHLGGQVEGNKSLFYPRYTFKSELASLIVVKGSKEHLDYIEVGRLPNLENTLRHEILHSLDVGKFLHNDYLEEGLVTYLAIKSRSSAIKQRFEIGDKDGESMDIPADPKIGEPKNIPTDPRLGLSFFMASIRAAQAYYKREYGPATAIFAVADKIASQEEGWSDDDYYEALISNKSKKRRELAIIMVTSADRVVKDYFNLVTLLYEDG